MGRKVCKREGPLGMPRVVALLHVNVVQPQVEAS